MQKVFEEVNSLDKRCYEKFGLTEDILMENAASSILNFIEKNFSYNSKILIVAGPGNNGADGIALSRMLHIAYDVSLYIPFSAKSKISKIQLKRVDSVGVDIISSLDSYDIIVDCLFGSGLNRELDGSSIKLINVLNSMASYKIACDIPSGINKNGQIENIAFISNTTITMGALKKIFIYR